MRVSSCSPDKPPEPGHYRRTPSITTQASDRSPSGPVRAAWLLLGRAGLASLVLGSVLSFTAPVFWLGELFANLRWQMGVGGLLGAAALAGLRRPRQALTAAAVSAFHVVPALWLLWPPDRTAPADSAALRVATLNLNVDNEDFGPTLAWLAAERPELVALQEVPDPLWPELESLRRLYPYQIVAHGRPPAGEDEYGIALLSVHPLELDGSSAAEATIPSAVHFGPRGERPYLDCRVRLDGRRVHVVVVHPMRPGLPPRTAERDAYLARVASEVEWDPTSLVLGDFNATLYSPALGRFVERTGLRDSRPGFGRLASYRSDCWVDGVWLDLDHILVGDEFEVLQRGLGPALGSDHRPATATLAVRGLAP